MNVTKLIPTVALSLSLVLFTSCKIENLASDLEPYYKEITGSSDSTTYLTALSSAASTSTGSNTYDFQEGFKAGYAAGYSEAAKMNHVANSAMPAPAPAPVSTLAPVSSTVTASLSSADIPSWGYTSDASYTAEPEEKPVAKPAPKKSSSSSSRYSRYSRSRSSRSCAGGS